MHIQGKKEKTNWARPGFGWQKGKVGVAQGDGGKINPFLVGTCKVSGGAESSLFRWALRRQLGSHTPGSLKLGVRKLVKG